jgi:hypothetical protein
VCIKKWIPEGTHFLARSKEMRSDTGAAAHGHDRHMHGFDLNFNAGRVAFLTSAGADVGLDFHGGALY